MPAAELPIVDLHFHVGNEWSADSLVGLFDQLGIRRAGNGAYVADTLHARFAGRYPDRLVAFGGYTTIRRFILAEGERAWRLQSPALVDYLEQLEEDLRAGRYRGIGELHANNQNSSPQGYQATRYPADSPLMQRLWTLSARYRAPLSVHMDNADGSVVEMERLLASNRQGIWLWAHCGHFAEPPQLRRLFAAHPNLYCELSWRDWPRSRAPINPGGRLRADWKELLEAFPDRFVIGTDPIPETARNLTDIIRNWRALLAELSPDAAAMLSHRNAERLIGRPS